MPAYIQGLKDESGNKIYPKTKDEAVFDSNGVPLSEKSFIIDGFSFTDTTYTVNDTRIRDGAVATVYYNENYSIVPTYEIGVGYITITLDSNPGAVIVDAVQVMNK